MKDKAGCRDQRTTQSGGQHLFEADTRPVEDRRTGDSFALVNPSFYLRTAHVEGLTTPLH